MAGIIDYQRMQGDEMADWDAMSDAKLAYSEFGDNTQNIATEWARRSVLHYQEFYRECTEQGFRVGEDECTAPSRCGAICRLER
jgi:hypothetical protein